MTRRDRTEGDHRSHDEQDDGGRGGCGYERGAGRTVDLWSGQHHRSLELDRFARATRRLQGERLVEVDRHVVERDQRQDTVDDREFAHALAAGVERRSRRAIAGALPPWAGAPGRGRGRPRSPRRALPDRDRGSQAVPTV